MDSAKKVFVLLFLMIVFSKNANGMIGFPIISSYGIQNGREDSFFFHPLGGTRQIFTQESIQGKSHQKKIMDEVFLYPVLDFYYI